MKRLSSCVEKKTPDYISLDLLPLSNPYLNSVDYQIWRSLRNDTDMSINWNHNWFGSDATLTALGACVRAKSGYFEQTVTMWIHSQWPSIICFVWLARSNTPIPYFVVKYIEMLVSTEQFFRYGTVQLVGGDRLFYRMHAQIISDCDCEKKVKCCQQKPKLLRFLGTQWQVCRLSAVYGGYTSRDVHESNCNCNSNDNISNAPPTSRPTAHYMVHKCLFIGAQ